MPQTISATKARIHFGELMRQVAAEGQPVIVERSGTPQVVILSVSHYERLKQAEQAQTDWMQRVDEVRRQVAKELGGRKLPPAEEIIRQMREERDAQLMDLC